MLKQFLESFNIFSDAETDAIIKVFKRKQLKKSEFLIREGERSNDVVFIESGIFRSFYVSNDGDEITYCITFPNNLMTAYSSFITGGTTVENIQAITPVEMLVISRTKVKSFEKQFPNWTRFLKVMAEQQYIALENRVFSLQMDKASERYRMLIENHPEYVRTIPLQYLASYLGITQRHLSRIRREISF